MGVIRSVLSNTFVSKTKLDLEQVSAKLADATAALRALEQERQERALDAALDDDPSALLDIEGRLTAARSRVESLEMAHGEASRRENQRLAKVRTDAEKARVGAIRQHAAAASRNASKISEALATAIGAYHDAAKDVAKVEKLLGNRERVQALGSGNLLVELKKMVSVEVARLAQQHTETEALAWPHVSFSSSVNGLRHGQALSEVGELSARIKARFDVSGFIASAPASTPAVDAEAVADHEAAAEIPVDEHPGELSAEDEALLTAAQTAGAEVSSARLADNWVAAKEQFDAAR